MNTAFHRAALLALLLHASLPALAESPAAAAEAAAARGEYGEAARLYQEAARQSKDGGAADYSLAAAEALMAAGNPSGVDPLLQKLPPASLDGRQFQRAGLLRARARLLLGDPRGALQALPASFDAPLAAEGLALRAQAQFALGDAVGGTASRVARDPLLNAEAREANQQALWAELGRATLPEGEVGSGNPLVSGWIELAQLARGGAPLLALEAWQASHPGHPGQSQLPALFLPDTPATAPAAGGARHYALLLPLSGPLAGAAQTLRAGAEAARQQAGPDAPALSVHDVVPGLEAAQQAAIAAGAGLLIGPLRKEDVAALASSPLRLPTLALNYLDAGRSPPAGLTPFGLAPEDEALAAAEDAAGAGQLRALILSQQGDWGERVAQAFRSQLEARGGRVLAEARFAPSTVDFSTSLKQLLALDASEQRAKQLANIGIRAESAARPRGDADVIFIGARAAQAKLIWPQLRYFRAGRIATYAPAAAADAGPADLGGLRVCDAPWRLDTTGPLADLRGTLATVNPRSPDAQRLFALGYDAYNLARRMQSEGLAPGSAIPGLTGELVIEADAALHRRLSCTTLVAPNPVSDEGGE
jgi:outer membrane PBP1 activator LpoA protein